MKLRHIPTLSELPPPPQGKTGWPWTEESPKIPSGTLNDNLWPRIGIITPSYNQVNFVEQTIRSVLLQGYPNLEYMIIDGNSTDGSQEVIRKYEEWLDYWVSEPDRGHAHALNKGAARTSGEIFGWLNSDDFFMPGALQCVAGMYREHSDAVAWIGGCYRIKPDGLILSRVIPRNLDRDSLADWWWQGNFFQPSCFFTNRAWKELGYLDENLYIAFDVEWWLRLATLGKFASTSEMISVATIHQEAKTQKFRGMKMRSDMSIVQTRYGYQDYQKITNSWLVRSMKSKLVRRRVMQALGEILMSRVHRYCPWEWRRHPRQIQTVLSEMSDQ